LLSDVGLVKIHSVSEGTESVSAGSLGAGTSFGVSENSSVVLVLARVGVAAGERSGSFVGVSHAGSVSSGFSGLAEGEVAGEVLDFRAILGGEVGDTGLVDITAVSVDTIVVVETSSSGVGLRSAGLIGTVIETRETSVAFRVSGASGIRGFTDACVVRASGSAETCGLVVTLSSGVAGSWSVSVGSAAYDGVCVRVGCAPVAG
jgi:hypothetical protein